MIPGDASLDNSGQLCCLPCGFSYFWSVASPGRPASEPGDLEHGGQAAPASQKRHAAIVITTSAGLPVQCFFQSGDKTGCEIYSFLQSRQTPFERMVVGGEERTEARNS